MRFVIILKNMERIEIEGDAVKSYTRAAAFDFLRLGSIERVIVSRGRGVVAEFDGAIVGGWFEGEEENGKEEKTDEEKAAEPVRLAAGPEEGSGAG